MRTLLGVAAFLREVIHPNARPVDRRHASVNQDLGSGAKGGEPPCFFFATSFFFPQRFLRDEFAIVHDPLLVVHQLWNEVSKASAGLQEFEALPTEAYSALTYSRSAQARVV